MTAATECTTCGRSSGEHAGCDRCLPATRTEIWIAWALRLVLVSTAVIFVVSGHVLYAAVCLFTLVLVLIPPLLARTSKANVPVELELILLWFFVADNTLGRLFGLYGTAWFDKTLHFGNSIFVGFLGFLLVYVLLYTSRIQLPAWFTAMTILLVAVGIGAVWELVEFFADLTLHAGAQGSPVMSPLTDTMWDLLLDLGGGLVGAVVGPLYLAHSSRSRCRFSAFAHYMVSRGNR